jgi:neutral ceramidase
MAVAYDIGTGIADVTDTAAGLPMQGMADKNQISTGVESPLYARAFVIAESPAAGAGARVAIIVADIWAGTRKVKDEVLARLATSCPGLYTEENTLLAGTHTHSAPGGYSGMLMYDFDFVRGGCDEATVGCIAAGCVRAVEMAHAGLAPGRIYVNTGEVSDCGGNRSAPAYLCNPQAERDQWGADTDRQMLLLKFVKVDGGEERPIGVLSWYAIHATDRGQTNTLVCGDNKGYASFLFEQQMGSDPGQPDAFVAAFANANCGDVSPNVELGHPPDGIHDRAQMQKHGRQQFETALQLFQNATEEITGPVEYRHTRVDFSNVTIGTSTATRTWPAALGISFTAGSSEDSFPVPDLGIKEGVTVANISDGDVVITAAASLGLSVIFGVSVIDQATAASVRAEHLPKPVVFMPNLEAHPGVPQALPVQLLRVGTFALLGIPGELTTMAGRRLRATVLNTMKGIPIEHVALGTYANEYSQYITTIEEYGSQQYEGASTLWGPHTLEAYQQVAASLATAILQGKPSPPGPPPTAWSAPPQPRYRFRNLSDSSLALRFYHTDDVLELFTLPNGSKTIEAHAEVAYPEREFTGHLLPTVGKLKVRVSHALKPTMSAGQLLTIAADGAISVGDYTPPPR